MTSMLEPGIFRNPRPKKNHLIPPNKRRKVEHKIEEISFDPNARENYLTGFRKRKLQRSKIAQAEAAKKAREEKIQMRKQLRQERKQELEDHVHAVNALLKGNNELDDVDTWNGIEDHHMSEFSNQEEEYVDEDRFTTVTVEAIEVSKEGLRNNSNQNEELEEDTELIKNGGKSDGLNKKWPKKSRKKAFRYETKVDRKLTRAKQKAGRSARADSRRGND